MNKCLILTPKKFLVAAAAILALVWYHEDNKKESPKPETPQEATQRQINAIPEDDGISYIGDTRTGMCYAVNRYHTHYHTATTISCVPCTEEVLALIPEPKDRPSFKAKSLPDASAQP